MLGCPTCGADVELRTMLLEEPSLRVEACARCNGIWIPAGAYAHWLERHSPEDNGAAESDVAQFEPKDGPFLRKCPTCAYILGRYRVGTEVHFTVDRCHNCGGIWLDAHEWDVLKAKHLHDRLQAVFTSEWQQNIRRREADEKEDAYRRRILGSEGYDRLLEFEAWVKEHPYRQVILELLAESLAPHVARHYQEEDVQR